MASAVSDALKHAPKKPHKKELGNAIGDWISKAKHGSVKAIKVKFK